MQKVVYISNSRDFTEQNDINELLTLVSNIAKDLQNEGFIEGHFEKRIPIIVHGLEYAWYDIEATKNANPNGEAETFFTACKKLGFC